MGTKTGVDNAEDGGKAVSKSVRRPVLVDNEIFTFAPRVSSKSVKIAQSLGTDFMARQQQHLERQKRNLETCNLQYRALGGYQSNKQSKNKGPSELSPNAKEETSRDGVDKNESILDVDAPSSPKSPCSDDQGYSEGEDDPENLNLSRTKTMPPQSSNRPQIARKLTMVPAKIDPGSDRIKYAKTTAEKAMKHRKIFTIQGPYRAIRESLRSRGWVEKFYKLHMARPRRSQKARKKKVSTSTTATTTTTTATTENAVDNVDDDQDDDSDDDDNPDDDDDDDDPEEECKMPPWNEDNGTYGIMSRMVRNSTPTFIWCVRRDAVDQRHMREDQVINHYGKATFTTKVGLCLNMRNVPWFEPVDPDTFFPRCYRLSHDEEKQAFIDDYRLTMCMNIMKIAVDLCENRPSTESGEENISTLESSDVKNSEIKDNPGTNSRVATPTQAPGSPNRVGLPPLVDNGQNCLTTSPQGSPRKSRKKKGGTVPVKALEVAIKHIKAYIKFRNHEDLDTEEDSHTLSEEEWDEMLKWYYQLVHEEATMPEAESKLAETKVTIDRIKAKWSQFEMDGTRNVWIVKPGAKSRGRGIICYDRLEDMLRLVSSTVVKKESKFVVQKYIERPLLVYNTKFDIRQWFLVTDWNPLTIYFYKACYLRFCSQEYTLHNFDEAIHLSNNAIQGKKVNGPRSTELPDDNMWTHEDFKSYLADRGAGDVWDDVVYPGMKQAINAALLCTQDIVEYRKSAFELYGADFMMTEDYQPWLIEINSSPSMSHSTKITAKLCTEVLQDTIKVVLDRKYDKNCDIGEFELSYKQPTVTVPPYIGMTLLVEGQNVKKPAWMRKSIDEGTTKPLPGLRLSEASTCSSQTSLGETSKTIPRTSASAEFTSFTKAAPLHTGVVHSASSHARLGGNSSGPKVTLSSSATSVNDNNNAQEKLRANSANQLSGRMVSQPSPTYRLAREQTKASSMKRSAYLAALRRGDGKSEALDKNKENESVSVKPIVNNLTASLSAARSSVTPSPIPIEFNSREEVGCPPKTATRTSHKDTQMSLHTKEIEPPSVPSDSETNLHASQASDSIPDLCETHAQLVKGSKTSRTSTLITDNTTTRWVERCPYCCADKSLRWERVGKISDCHCPSENVYSTQGSHWASSVFRPPGRTLRMTVAPWPVCNTSCLSKSDVDLDTSQHSNILEPASATKRDELSEEIVFPKKIDIDSTKLLSSVCAKTQRAQTVCTPRSLYEKRTLLRCPDAHIKKPDSFSARCLDFSYSRKLSNSCSARAIQGFPNMLSRFKLNGYQSKGTGSTLHLEESTKSPKVTFYQPRFM